MTTSAARDGQRSALYAAEDQVGRLLDRAAEFPIVTVAGSRVTLPQERHFGDIAGVQRYLDALLQLEWVRARWPESAAQSITVRRRNGHTRAHYERATATVAVPLGIPEAPGPGWAMRELVILHEAAHHLGNVPGGRANASEAAHGPAFAGRLCELLDGVVGPEAGFLLRVMLADQGAVIGTAS